MNQKKIGNFLKELRLEHGLTQQDLADILNVNNRTISRWENGRNLPDYAVMMEIANYYHLQVDEILNGEKCTNKIKWYQKYVIMNAFNYYVMTILFIILSIILNSLFYFLGFYGDVNGMFISILKSFIWSFFNPLEIIFVVGFIGLGIYHYKTKFKNMKDEVIIRLAPFNFIFIPILLFMTVALFWIWLYAPVSWLIAFIFIFYDATILFYGYVVRWHKLIDKHILLSTFFK